MALRTITQFASEERLTRYQVDELIASGLGFVRVGARKMIPDGAWERYLADNTVNLCRDETTAHASVGSTSVDASTSLGLKTVAAGSAARARLIGQQLKSRSQNSSTTEPAEVGRVIQLRSS